MPLKLFISYRRDDSAGHAGRMHDRLQREFGRDVLFMDVDSIPLGTNFVNVLGEEIAKCDALLAIIGPGWLDARDDKGNRRLENPDDLVRMEIGTALKLGIRVIPILLEGTPVPNAEQLPDDLKELALRNGLNLRHASFPEDMKRLIRGVKSAQPRQQPVRAKNSLVDPHRTPSYGLSLVWNFLSNDKNRKVLGWIGGGFAVVISALWAALPILPMSPGATRKEACLTNPVIGISEIARTYASLMARDKGNLYYKWEGGVAAETGLANEFKITDIFARDGRLVIRYDWQSGVLELSPVQREGTVPFISWEGTWSQHNGRGCMEMHIVLPELYEKGLGSYNSIIARGTWSSTTMSDSSTRWSAMILRK